LYFPHFADGGSRAQQWQTTFIFVNPSSSSAAAGELWLYGNDGNPLSIDFGSGLNSTFTFTVPPQGSLTFRSRIANPQTVTGWAIAVSTLPLQATVLFTNLINGVAVAEVSAPATLPTGKYWSPANNAIGVAVANPYVNISETMVITANDASGSTVASAPVTIGPHAHTSFNLYQIMPSLPSSFSGSILITPQVPTQNFLAWTLNVDSGTISTLPSGNARWPISHSDRIWLVYMKVLDASRRLAASGLGTDLTVNPPQLIISADPVINAFATPPNTVQINLALSELISDSPGELAFAVGHELGHIVQFRTNRLVFNADREFDADEYGMFFSLAAGYDPYAAAGTLAKLSMATNDASLISQLFDNISGDLHGSFNQRLAAVFATISALCELPAATQSCAVYRDTVHPHFPPSVPLAKPVLNAGNGVR
jgi:hypothetical protein